MTNEQMALLSHAAEGHVLVTVMGSENDLVWTELSDHGWMEAADLPETFSKIENLNWTAWRMTPEGIAALRARQEHPNG